MDEGGPSRALSAIARATAGTAWEGGLFLVGGAVRDRLLGRPMPHDLDIVLEGDAMELTEYLWKTGATETTPALFERFGTAMVRIEGEQVEFVTARKESYTDDSRKPEVVPATLLDDARRRDFTVNALMQNVHTGELTDPLDRGLDDLRTRTLRTPLEPQRTFYDDPLRMLRAIRFRYQLGFEPATGLYEGILSQAERLAIISAERIREELGKMLLLPDADRCLDDMMRLGLIAQFAPEFHSMVGVEQGRFHHLDVWDHTLLVIRNAGPGDEILSLACLLHDVGKPRTRSIDENGNTRFFSHENVGEEIARALLGRMRYPNETVSRVARLVRNHMRLGSSPKFSPSAARRVLRDLGDDTDRLLALVEADTRALKPGVLAMDLEAVREQIERVRNATPAETLRSPLNGMQIMERLGEQEGSTIGAAKAYLTELVLDGKLLPCDTDAAFLALDKWAAQR